MKYHKNVVFVDVIEAVNMLVSAKGTLLRSDVHGQVLIDLLPPLCSLPSYLWVGSVCDDDA